MSARSLCACAVVLLFAGGVARAGAKPADLPSAWRVKCRCEEEETRTPGPQRELDQNTADSPEEGGGFFAALAGYLRAIRQPVSSMPPTPPSIAIESKASAPSCSALPSHEVPEFTCPYLKAKARAQALLHDAESGHDLADNLRRLRQADRTYKKAEWCRVHGQAERAHRYYEQVERLCPGSRYDQMAKTRLTEMQSQAPSETNDIGAEDEENTPQSRGRHTDEGCSPEVQVARLLEHCRKAYNQGQYARAQELADRALALSPACVAAHALIYKMHLLTQLRDRQTVLENRGASAAQSELPEFLCSLPGVFNAFEASQPCCRLETVLDEAAAIEVAFSQAAHGLMSQVASCGQPANAAPGKAEVTLRPTPPPIDAATISDFERILSEEEEGAGRRPSVLIEESGGNEEQDGAPAVNPPQPKLTLPPAPGDLHLQPPAQD